MSSRPTASIMGLALLVVLSGCGAVRVERPATEVGIDPCTLLRPADVEQVMGHPASGRLAFRLGPSTLKEFLQYDRVNDSRSCLFQIPPDTGLPSTETEFTYVSVSIADRAWSDEEVRAEFDADAKEEDPPTPIEGLGRMAVTRSYHGALQYRYLRVLGEHGVFLRLDVEDEREPDSPVLDHATELLRRALERAEAAFPGDPSALPVPPPAPVDPCTLVAPDEAAATFSKPVPEREGIYATGPGLLGNSWTCSWGFGAATLEVELSERAASAEQMAAAGGEPLKGFPGVAFAWKRAGKLWPYAAVVVPVNGRSVKVSAEQDGSSTESMLELARRQAETASARLAKVQR